MRAVKGNKEYMIGDGQRKNYQDAGFDILNEDGEIIAYGRGKTVPYGDYMALVKENKALHEKIAELEKEQKPEASEEPLEETPEERKPDKKASKKAGE